MWENAAPSPVRSLARAEVDGIRARSKASGNGPWVSDYEAMAKKTVIRRVFPYLPVSVNAAQAVGADESTPDYSDLFHPVIDEAPVASAPAVEGGER